MATYLRKFQTLSDFNAAKAAGTLDCPNTALIMADGSVKYTPSLVSSSIGIRGANGVCYTLAEWNALPAADKPNADGVYYYDAAAAKGFVIHPTINSGAAWCSDASNLIPGVTTTSSPLTDFAGKTNSQAVLDYVALNPSYTCPLFTWAAGLSFLDSSLEPYVPAAGELETIRINLADINACRTAIGQSEIVFNGVNIWSSTQHSANYAWGWLSSGWGGSGKDFNYRGLALAAF